MTIKTFDYLKSLSEIEEEVLTAIRRVLHSNRLILGPETAQLEAELSKYLGAKHCIAVNSGTTALHLSLLSLGVGSGDEVITVSNTCVPTVSAIRLVGARPVFVDVRHDDLMMDTRRLADMITPRTRCIIAVHLWGRCVDMDALCAIAEKNNIPIIEDCAQAFGTRYRGQHVGMFGNAGCFSFYPTKNLGAYGDAGAIISNDDSHAERLRRMRMYGYDRQGTSQIEGMNARINEIQAAILRVKLKVFPEWLQRRRTIAKLYNEHIDNGEIHIPPCIAPCENSYHQYIVRSEHRDSLKEWLARCDIDSGIHYAQPVHDMPAYRYLGYTSEELPNTISACNSVLSLPIHENLSVGEANSVVEALNKFKPTGTREI